MLIFFKLLPLILLLNYCAGYKPLYKKQQSHLYKLQSIALVTDKKKASESIKKQILELIPARKTVSFIVEIFSTNSTSSTVSNIDTQITGYEIEIIAEVKIYKRNKQKDVLIYSFTEKEAAPYHLTTNKVLSTLANRNNAEYLVVKKLSKNIYDRIIIFIIKENQNVS